MSLGARWLDGEILSTDQYVKTVAPLARNAAVQEAIAKQVAKGISTQIGQQGNGQSRGAIAELLGGGVEQVTYRVVLSFAQSDAFRTVWIAMNRTAHDQLVAALEGRPGSILSVGGDGALTLELSPVIVAVARQLSGLGLASDELDSISVKMRVGSIRGIAPARRAALWLARTAFWLPLLTVAVLAGAVMSAVDRRRMLIGVGAGVVLTMGVFSVLLTVGRWLMVSAVSDSDLNGAASAVVEQFVGPLRGEMWWTTAAGLVMAGVGLGLVAARRIGHGAPHRWPSPQGLFRDRRHGRR